jgi:hydroxypyruvate reductase
MPDMAGARQDLLTIYQAAITRVEGRRCVREALQDAPGRVSLIALGKAAQSMAEGALDALGERVLDGLVISKPGHLDRQALSARGLTGLEGGHPLPDQNSLQAGAALVEFLRRQPADRELLFLISGGTSGLVESLRDGVDLDSLQRINQWLLGSGLPIDAMNRVRTALSRIKGGGLIPLLQGRPARVLLISDVPGDDPGVIGSGMLVAGPHADALDDLKLPAWLTALLPDTGRPTPAPADNIRLGIVASLADAREAAAARARELGYAVTLNRAHLGGDAAVLGRRLGYELCDAWPGLYIWGGEPTMQLPEQPGQGGRNQHLALVVASQIAGRRDICFLAAGTDGSDGPGEDAGALVDGGSVGRGSRALGIDPEVCLARADSGRFLEASGDLIQTGPTGTNVMDLMIGLKMPN